MHAYRRFIERNLVERSWRAQQLALASGLSRGLISRILTDTRSKLTKLPDENTLDRLSEAFELPVAIVKQSVAEAMGLVESTTTPDLSEISTEHLIDELHRRTTGKVAVKQRIAQQATTIETEHLRSTLL